MRKLVSASVLVTVCLSMAALAQASTITWTVNATLSDGATVTGFFVFNPDLGPYQSITNFNINISAATQSPLLSPPYLPSSVFFPFAFTPANSTAVGPFLTNDGAFEFSSDTIFPNPITGYPPESLIFDFVPVSPLSDASSTIINNSTIRVNGPWSGECFDCNPYVCFVDNSCVSGAVTPTPEPPSYALFLAGLVIIGVVMLCAKPMWRPAKQDRRPIFAEGGSLKWPSLRVMLHLSEKAT